MPNIPIDPARLAEELAADEDVVRDLRENGDVAESVRPVDAHFVGHAEAISRIEDDAEQLGWRVVDVTEEDDGQVTLWLQRDQTATDSALRALTEDALRIEATYGVDYDGWGTVAATETDHRP